MLPHELVSKHVIPWLRALVARRLAEAGVTQAGIARVLSVTQPMVSRYLRMPEERLRRKFEETGIDFGETSAVASSIADSLRRGSMIEANQLMTSYMQQLLASGRLCELHRRIDWWAGPDCRICVEVMGGPVLVTVESVKTAYRILAAHRHATLAVPEVGSNIVEAPEGARSAEDFVGFSGRIVRVGERLIALGDPVPGGSRHTAKVLEKVMRVVPSYRGVIVARGSREIIEGLKAAGASVAEAGPAERLEEVGDQVADAVAQGADAVYHVGGQGIEPVVYVFGSTAIEAAAKLVRALDAISS